MEKDELKIKIENQRVKLSKSKKDYDDSRADYSTKRDVWKQDVTDLNSLQIQMDQLNKSDDTTGK